MYCGLEWNWRAPIIRGRNKFYLLDQSFLVLTKITWQLNYCNLGFWWCSKLLVWSSFTASFHHCSYNEVSDLQKINLFTLIQYFCSKNTVIYCHLVSSALDIQSSTRFTISQSQHSKNYSMSLHTNTLWNIIPLIYDA